MSRLAHLLPSLAVVQQGCYDDPAFIEPSNGGGSPIFAMGLVSLEARLAGGRWIHFWHLGPMGRASVGRKFDFERCGEDDSAIQISCHRIRLRSG